MAHGKKPKIIIIGNYLPDKQESMLRVSNLYRDIIGKSGVRIETIRPSDRVGKLRIFFPKIEKWLNYLDKFVIFAIELIGHNIRHSSDKNIVYHITDHSNSIYSLFLFNKPKIITCHDVLAINSMLGKIPQNKTRFSGVILQKLILIGLKSNRRIVCVSKKTERELKELIGDKKTKITTTLQPLNYDFKPIKRENALKKTLIQKAGKKINIENGFILHIGGNQWYKNRRGVCEIYAEIDKLRCNNSQPSIPLILAGKQPSQEIVRFIRNNTKLNINIIITPSNEEINALYCLAKLLLFPSIEEGFGWPIIEAMACGCPVVTTNREPMTEAGGKAGIYIDISDIKSSARITNEVIEWSEERKEMQVKLGYQNVKRFSRNKFAKEYRRAYEDALRIQLGGVNINTI